MVKLKSVFTEEKMNKDRVVSIRFTDEELALIKTLAVKYSGGNATKFIRKALLEVMPSLDKEEVKTKGKK